MSKYWQREEGDNEKKIEYFLHILAIHQRPAPALLNGNGHVVDKTYLKRRFNNVDTIYSIHHRSMLLNIQVFREESVSFEMYVSCEPVMKTQQKTEFASAQAKGSCKRKLSKCQMFPSLCELILSIFHWKLFGISTTFRLASFVLLILVGY